MINSNFFRWFTVPSTFRYSFFILLIFSAIINGFFVETFFLYPLYIVTVIFLGIGYAHKTLLFLISFSTFVVLCRIFLTPEPLPTLGEALLHWFTYTIIMLISVGLMRNYEKIKQSKIELILALVNSLDSRDTYTASHSESVAYYAERIAREMKWPSYKCEAIYVGGLLHDIGKIGIPEFILTKSERLTAQEFKIIQRHPEIGYDTLKHISSFRENGVLEMVKYHHEHFNGNGYPDGLKGENIPLEARIISIADSFDAMTSKRKYRDDLGWEYAINELQVNRSIQFDPVITDLFISLLEKEGPTFLNKDDMNRKKKFSRIRKISLF